MQVRAQAYSFDANEIDFVTGSIRSMLENHEFLTLGRYVEQFEEQFGARHGETTAIATNSGTSALEAILRAIDVEGGEVVVPANTFAATAFAVVRAGATPVFADIADDLVVDPGDVAARIGPATRAVITVHVGGLVSPSIYELMELCGGASIPLVEDAAHAHGSALDGRSAGSFGVAGAFSFFSTKVMTTGEGGMVTTTDPTIRDVVRELRDQAKVANGNLHERVGANWRMTEIEAVLGISQLRHLDDFISRRQEVAERYRTGLAGVPGVSVVSVPHGSVHNFYKLIVLLERVCPGDLRSALKRDYGVAMGGSVYDIPLHQQPVFTRYAHGTLPVAEDLCRRHVCPPIYPALTDSEVDYVIASMRSAIVKLDPGWR
jgi:perosamine synthetase